MRGLNAQPRSLVEEVRRLRSQVAQLQARPARPYQVFDVREGSNPMVAGDASAATANLEAVKERMRAASEVGAGVVFIPAGDWYVNGVIPHYNHVTLLGRSSYGQADAGEETRLIQTDNTANTIRQVSSSGHTEGMGIENLTIVYQDSSRTTGGGVVFEDDGGGSFIGLNIKNVVVRYHDRGIHVENTVASTFEKCRVLNCGRAFLIDTDASGAGITTTVFRDCFAQNCDGPGWDVNAVTLASCAWHNCAADACSSVWDFGGATLRNVGLYNDYGEDRATGTDLDNAIISSGSWQGFLVVGLTVYNAQGHGLLLSGSGDMTMIGGRIQGTAAGFYDINHTGTGKLNLIGDFKVICTGGGAGRINDANGNVVYVDHRTLQSQFQDSGGANTVEAQHTQDGIVSLAGNTGASAVTTTVTYPEGYSAIKGVVATLQGPTLGGDVVTVSVQSVGANSFVVRAATVDGANFANTDPEDIFWIAKGIRF